MWPAAAGWARPLFSSAVVKPGKVRGRLLQPMLDSLLALASPWGSLPGCRSVAASRKPTCEVLAASEMAPSTVALCACRGSSVIHGVLPAAISVAAECAACSMVPARRAQAVLLRAAACPVWGRSMPTRDTFRPSIHSSCCAATSSCSIMMCQIQALQLTCGRLVMMSSVHALGTVTMMDAARGPPELVAGTVTPTESAQPGMQLHGSRAWIWATAGAAPGCCEQGRHKSGHEYTRTEVIPQTKAHVC